MISGLCLRMVLTLSSARYFQESRPSTCAAVATLMLKLITLNDISMSAFRASIMAFCIHSHSSDYPGLGSSSPPNHDDSTRAADGPGRRFGNHERHDSVIARSET